MASAFSCLMTFEQVNNVHIVKKWPWGPFEWHRILVPAKDKHFFKLLDTAYDDVQIKTAEYLFFITRGCLQ